MRKAAVIFVLALFLLVPLSVAYDPGTQAGDINVADYPQITIQGAKNITFNVTFFGLGIIIPALNIKHLVRFDSADWNVKSLGQNGVSYSTTVNMIPEPGEDSLVSSTNVTSGSLLSNIKSFNVKVYVNISKFSRSGAILRVLSNDLADSNLRFQNLSVNTIEINNTIIAPKLPTPYKLMLVQRVTGKQSQTGAFLQPNLFNAKLVQKETSGIAFSESHNLSRALGLYWWIHNYTLNSNIKPVDAVLSSTTQTPFLNFSYNLSGNQTNRMDQDPFFTVISGNLVKSTIVSKKLVDFEKYILANSEYFSIGVIVGSLFIFTAYIGYRRRRI